MSNIVPTVIQSVLITWPGLVLSSRFLWDSSGIRIPWTIRGRVFLRLTRGLPQGNKAPCILNRSVSACLDTEDCELKVDKKNAQKSRFNQAPQPATEPHITRRNAENGSTEAQISTTNHPNRSEDQLVRCGSRARKRSIQGMDKL